MIDPKDFINVKPKEESKDELMSVSGSFMCQQCLESVSYARLDEDEMTLTYVCKEGHVNEASL